MLLGFLHNLLSGPPTAGAVYDSSKSYDIPFYLAGGFIILSSMVLSIAAIFQKPKGKAGPKTISYNANDVKNIEM